jgi:4-amino-4-deoxy-L-arabinose transferase-like glycosyltransferase
VVLAAVAPWVRLGARDLWNPDEADHAVAARELLQEGRWAIPTIAGETFAEKPPLQLWGMVLSARIRGTDVDEFDARVPSAIGNALLILAVFAMAVRSGGMRTASLACLAAATCGEWMLRSRWCQVDALFAGCFAWASLGTLRLLERPGWKAAGVVAISLGAAILTKGPLAPALLLATVLLDAALTVEHRRRWIGSAGLWLVASCAVAAALALPWYIALAATDAEGFWRSLLFENFRRFAASQDHQHPFYYYFAGAMWSSFAPASLILVPAAVFAFETTGTNARERLWLRDPSAVRFSLAGLIGGILLLSAASSKQGKYVLPLLPFVACIVADFARHVDRFGRPWQRHWFTAVFSLVSLVFVIFALFLLAASWFGRRADDAFASLVSAFADADAPLPPIGTVLAPLLLAGFGSFVLLAIGMHTRASQRLAWFLAPLLLAMTWVGARTLPALDDAKSPRPVVERAMERLGELERAGRAPRYAVYFPDRPGDKAVESWTGTSPFVYYAASRWRKPLVIRGPAALAASVAEPTPLVLVVRADYHARLPAELRSRLAVRFQKPVGSRKLVVLESGS